MNGNCKSCDVEAQCGYPHKPTDCCNYRKFREIPKPPPLTETALVVGAKYNWKSQAERLVYWGKKGSWHQFVKVGAPEVVWCEVLTSDLHMLEVTKET